MNHRRPTNPDALSEARAAIAEIADQNGLTVEEVTAKDRHAPIVRVRAAIANHLYFNTELRLWEIADLIGVQDHSSVLYLVHRHEWKRVDRGWTTFGDKPLSRTETVSDNRGVEPTEYRRPR